MDIKNFKAYEPSDKIKGVLYLKSEDGKDWYDCQKGFKDDTIKIMYDIEGRIISINTDITTFFPIDSSMAELPKDTIIQQGDYYINGVFAGTQPSDNHIWDGSKWVEKQLTKAEKINAIKSEYEQRFKKLEVAQQRLLLIGKPTDAIKTQYMNLTSEMVARIKEVQ